MGNRQTPGRARNARINQAAKYTRELLILLEALQGSDHTESVEEPQEWRDGRETLNKLMQCFHEANAYNNMVQP